LLYLGFKLLPMAWNKPELNKPADHTDKLRALQQEKERLRGKNNKKMAFASKGLSFLKGLLPQGWQRMVMVEISNALKADGITDAKIRTADDGQIKIEIKMDDKWWPEVPLIDAFSFKETDMRKLMYDKFPEERQLPAANNGTQKTV
jgi:hypothetical protein